jgi:undecaprenyl-diphosphatase
MLTGLFELLRELTRWEGAALEAVHAAHWGPLTAVFVVASAWWVKWPLFAVLGACGDASRRCRPPLAALCATVAAVAAELLVVVLKLLTDRARPPLADPAIESLVALPDSASFPSGHAATAFAAAAAVGVLHPRFRLPLLAAAGMVALSRVYLGVHYWSDVLVGSLLGVAVALATVWVAERAGRARREREPSREPA